MFVKLFGCGAGFQPAISRLQALRFLSSNAE